MSTLLKREFAPMDDRAWQEMDEQASRLIRRCLAGRRVVDFNGPMGFDYAAVNLGRVKMASKKGPGQVGFGLREVLPLAEIWIPFSLSRMEIDNLTRGSADADIDAVEEAVKKAVEFEDTIIFQGFAGANMTGIVKGSEHKPVKMAKAADSYPESVAEAMKQLAMAGIGGPYALVLGPTAYFNLMQSAKQGYPPKKVISDMIEGEIILSPVVDGGVLVSMRGGDYELTVGTDYSIGYSGHDAQNVDFFLTESFAFRVLDGRAAVALTMPA